MRILELHVKNFQGIKDQHIEFRPQGITIIQGPNEVGKTSLIQALNMLLVYPDSSKDRHVAAVRPVAQDVGTEIEARLQVGQYNLTYFKRYHRNTETWVTEVHADSQNTLVGREAHDFVENILKTNVDWMLWEALQIQQGTAPTAASVSLANSVSLRTALDQAAGGSRSLSSDSLFQRGQKEYDRYYTAKGRPLTKVFGDLQSQREAAEKIAHDCLQAVAEAEQDTERMEQLEDRISALTAERSQASEDARKARGTLEALASLETQDRILLQKITDIGSIVQTLTQQADKRHQLAQAAETLHKDMASMEQQYTEVLRQEEETEQALTTVRVQYENIRQQRDAARHDYEVFRQDLEDFTTLEQLDKLKERLERIHSLHHQIAETDAQSTQIAIVGEAIPILRKLVEKVNQARATLEVGSPTVSVRALAPLTLLVDGENMSLGVEEEQTIPVQNRLSITLPELIEFSVRPGTSVAEMQKKLGLQEEKLAQQLEKFHVSSFGEAEDLWQRKQRLAQQIIATREILKQELDKDNEETLDKQYTELAARHENYLAQRSKNPPHPDHREAARDLSETAYLTMQTVEESFIQLRGNRDQALASHDQRQRELQKVTKDRIECINRAKETDQILERERTTQNDADLTAKLQEIAAQLQTLSAAQAAIKQDIVERDPETVRQGDDNARGRVERLDGEISYLQQERAECKGRLAKVGGLGLYEQWQEADTTFQRVQESLHELERRAEAAELLYKTLKACREEEQQAYREPLQTRIIQLGRSVFGSDFDVVLDDNLTVIQRILHKVTLPLDRLSTGAKEQMALIVRLAVASLVASKEGVPVILDDTLGYTDEDRLERMAAVLNRVGLDCQIILLTSTPHRYTWIGNAHVVELWGVIDSVISRGQKS